MSLKRMIIKDSSHHINQNQHYKASHDIDYAALKKKRTKW